MGSEDLVMAGRLSLAALLGGLVGLERDMVEKKMQVSITASCPEDHDLDKLGRAFGMRQEVERVEIV